MSRFLGQLVPPILKPVLKRTLRRRRWRRRVPQLGVPILSRGSYRVEFTRVELAGELYLVPRYAVHRPACQAVLSGRRYEPLTHDLVRDLLSARGGDLIHAGTFFGDMLPSFSRRCPGTVYAFEPVLENYLLAKLSIEQNDLANVAIFNAGLGSGLSIARVDTGEQAGPHQGGASHMAEKGQRTCLMTIDSLGLADVSVIQLDVERFELEALRGAVQTIEACRPTILIEDNSENCGDFLRGLSYVYAGSVPGLRVWATASNQMGIRHILREVLGHTRKPVRKAG